MRAICRFIDAAKPAAGRSFPPILGGDFNADPDSDEIRMLSGRAATPVSKLVFHDAWEVAGQASDSSATGATWTNRNPYAKLDLEPDRRIDYLFVGWPKAGGAGHVTRCTVEALEPVDGVVPSDHLAVLAEAALLTSAADEDRSVAGRFADLPQGVAQGDPQATGDGGGEVGDQARARVADLLDREHHAGLRVLVVVADGDRP